MTWEKLTELYLDLGQFESALLTLNSCPMFTFNGRDAHRNLTPSRVHLPFQRQIGEILPERAKTDDDEADPALQRLPSPGLRGTWARAYTLLTRLVSQIGWDELLKTRSSVFVMGRGISDAEGPRGILPILRTAARRQSTKTAVFNRRQQPLIMHQRVGWYRPIAPVRTL